MPYQHRKEQASSQPINLTPSVLTFMQIQLHTACWDTAGFYCLDVQSSLVVRVISHLTLPVCTQLKASNSEQPFSSAEQSFLLQCNKLIMQNDFWKVTKCIHSGREIFHFWSMVHASNLFLVVPLSFLYTLLSPSCPESIYECCLYQTGDSYGILAPRIPILCHETFKS